jgi:hypothetical protein
VVLLLELVVVVVVVELWELVAELLESEPTFNSPELAESLLFFTLKLPLWVLRFN